MGCGLRTLRGFKKERFRGGWRPPCSPVSGLDFPPPFPASRFPLVFPLGFPLVPSLEGRLVV